MKNFKNIKSAYFLGIKGVGMTMLAQYLANLKIKVSGSDICQEFMTDIALRKNKIKVFCPYSIENINKEADLFVYTSAIKGQDNLELDYIEKEFSKKKVLSYAQALSIAFNSQKGIAVCGSHGKTTTSAWLGFVLKELKLSPQVLVGSYVKQFKGNVFLGKSKIMVAETDEYQNKLKYYKPFGVILNNIDFDHPDFFKNEDDYFQVFIDFVKKIPKNGFLVVNIDDDLAKKTIKYCKGKVITYSILKDNQADLFVDNYQFKNNHIHFSLNDLGDYKISLLGKHNIYNALAVLGACKALKIEIKKAKSALLKFKGTARRSEFLGSFKDVPIYDDYAHHPTEIKACLSSFREKYPNKRLVVLFHPHTFSRTKALFADFSKSFSQADVLGVLKIFASAREKKSDVSSMDLVKAIKKEKEDTLVSYLDNFEIALMWLKKTLAKDDVLLLVGAGDVNNIAKDLLKMNK